MAVSAGRLYLRTSNWQSTDANYSFRFLNASSPTAVSLGSLVDDSLSPSRATDLYRFEGIAGTRYFLKGDGIGGCGGYWDILREDNRQTLTGNCLHGNMEFTTPNSGSYLIAVHSGNGSVPNIPYPFRVTTASDVVTPLPGFDVAVHDSLANPGNTRQFTFHGSAGDQLYYQTLNGARQYIDATLLAADNQVVWSGYANSDSGPIELPFDCAADPCQYRLVFDGSDAATRTIDFELLNASNASPLAPNTFVSAELASGRDARAYHFSALANQRFYLDAQLGSGTPISWSVVDWHGVPIAGSSGFFDRDFTAPLADELTLVIRGYNDEPGTLPFAFRLGTPCKTCW